MLALPYLEENSDVLEQMLSVETADRQSFDFITCCRDTLHFHSAECSYKQNLGIRALGLDGVCDGYGREYMTACTASTYDNSQFIIHNPFLFTTRGSTIFTQR